MTRCSYLCLAPCGNLNTTYFPKCCGCFPIHEVVCWKQVRRLIRAAIRKDSIPPIVIDKKWNQLLTGTHRSAANEILIRMNQEPFIQVADLSDILLKPGEQEDLKRAIADDDYFTVDEILKDAWRENPASYKKLRGYEYG